MKDHEMNEEVAKVRENHYMMEQIIEICGAKRFVTCLKIEMVSAYTAEKKFRDC